MRYIITIIIFTFILINLGVAGIMNSDMDDGHSFLCSSLLAGDCPADSGNSMFATHYLSIMQSLSGAALSASTLLLSLLLIALTLFLFYKNTGGNIGKLTRRIQYWRYNFFSHHLKLLRWIAYHNKGDNTVRVGLMNYSYV